MVVVVVALEGGCYMGWGSTEAVLVVVVEGGGGGGGEGEHGGEGEGGGGVLQLDPTDAVTERHVGAQWWVRAPMLHPSGGGHFVSPF